MSYVFLSWTLHNSTTLIQHVPTFHLHLHPHTHTQQCSILLYLCRHVSNQLQMRQPAVTTSFHNLVHCLSSTRASMGLPVRCTCTQQVQASVGTWHTHDHNRTILQHQHVSCVGSDHLVTLALLASGGTARMLCCQGGEHTLSHYQIKYTTNNNTHRDLLAGSS